MDSPPYIPPFPPDLLALLDDPRLADMKDSPDPLARSTRLLEPRDPPTPGRVAIWYWTQTLTTNADPDRCTGLIGRNAHWEESATGLASRG